MSTDERLERIEKLMEGVATSIQDFRSEVDGRFSEMDRRFSAMDGRFSEMDRRFSEMDGRFSEMDRRFSEMDGRFSEMDGRLKALETLPRYILDFRSEIIARLQIIDSRLSLMAATFGSLETSMSPLTKAVLNFGEVANRIQIEQSRTARLVEPAA